MGRCTGLDAGGADASATAPAQGVQRPQAAAVAPAQPPVAVVPASATVRSADATAPLVVPWAANPGAASSPRLSTNTNTALIIPLVMCVSFRPVVVNEKPDTPAGRPAP